MEVAVFRLGFQNDSFHMRLLHGVSREGVRVVLWWREGQAGDECGRHQDGDGTVMKLAKGMRVKRAHRSEPIAILHASRSQR